jgi:hypothetical protein
MHIFNAAGNCGVPFVTFPTNNPTTINTEFEAIYKIHGQYPLQNGS